MNDKTANELYLEGQKKTLSGDHKGAIEDYTESLKINPKDPNVLSHRAFEKTYLNDFNGAIEDYKKAKDLGFNKRLIDDNIKGLKKCIKQEEMTKKLAKIVKKNEQQNEIEL